MDEPRNSLNYNEPLFILIYTVTRCVSIFAFASLVGIPIEITSSAKKCVKAAGILKYKSMIKKKKKKHDKIVLLAESRLNSIKVLISKALIDSNISQNEFVLIIQVLKEYDVMKEKNKNDK